MILFPSWIVKGLETRINILGLYLTTLIELKLNCNILLNHKDYRQMYEDKLKYLKEWN